MASFKPPKQWVLTEQETITSFASWQSNIIYHLSLNNEFAQFIEPTAAWQKQSVTNRGLANDPNTVPENRRRTALQKNIILDQMLGLIAQFSPSLLRSDIIKRSTSLQWIWQRIRKHYSFCQSEVNFLKLSTIKRQEGERFETLFQRIVAHIEDNLLTTESGLTHDGAQVTENEEMSPTTERLAVYLWLNLIDERLPSYVARVFAHDLQSRSLKDIQPQICAAMDSLLTELNVQEDIQISYSRSSYNNRRYPGKPSQRKSHPQKSHQKSKSCILCKAASQPYQGHHVSTCWFISKFDKMEIASALAVEVDPGNDIDDPLEEHSDVKSCTSAPPADKQDTSVARVQSNSSPFFYAFLKHHTCRVVIDTGATSSLVSADFVARAGIKLNPTSHAARQIDKTPLNLLGEAKFKLSFGDYELPIEALVTEALDCDILAGVPFCKSNNIDVHLGAEEISLNQKRIPYGSRPNSIQHDIYRVQSTVLRNDSTSVVYPGEYLEIHNQAISHYEGEVAIEPRTDSPANGNWPPPTISRVINGTVRIPNETNSPVYVSKSQHIATIRRVTTPTPPTPFHQSEVISPASKPITDCKPKSIPFSSNISVDPDGQLTPSEKEQFLQLHKDYDNIFNPQFGVYNDNSGRIRAKINFGNVDPPPRKPKLPFYNQTQLQQLQEEADKLEALGVLAKPEDVGVDVQFASPSLLVKKPDGSFRFCTAFNELCQYTKVLPVASQSCDDVLRRLSSWKYLIKTDLTKSFFQIPLDSASVPYLGTVTPFKGLRVYLRSAMGMPGSSEHLQELTSRVLGDFIQEGFVTVIADDLHVGGNTIQETFINWSRVLHRLRENNLTLSASKTVICPKSTTVLGWRWTSGQLSVTPHKISPLVASAPPTTCTAMRSYIGAYKAIARCIPRHSSLLSPLEAIIKHMDGSQKINWSPEDLAHFKSSQEALKSPSILTIPTPDDQLIMTVDAAPVNNGIGATLYILRDNKRYLADNFSLKLKEHQYGWQPCEHEALAITAGVKHFSPYIRESKNPLQLLSDNKPCVQAFAKLKQGHFSASSRVSTFLACLSNYPITMCHLKGTSNPTSDFSSRHPQECSDSSCQICKFVNDTASSVVASVHVSDVLSGQARMPFLNSNAWRSAQHDCNDLRRTYAHLSKGTRPSRKTRNIRNLRRYLQVASISSDGLLIHRKQDPYVAERNLIIVPQQILPGLLTALHLHFRHATRNQLLQLFNRYFYALNCDDAVKNTVTNCAQCTSLQRLPKELVQQSSSPSPKSPGEQFASDVIRRAKQKILLTRDVHSSFTTATTIPDETADSLRASLISTTSLVRKDQCLIRVDNAPGFQALHNDEILHQHGITIDLGRIKNPNKNPVAERAVQEFEEELLRINPSGKAVSFSELSVAVNTINSRIRNRGLSAKEILFRRDQITGESLNVDDNHLSNQQEEYRHRNHAASALSKIKGHPMNLPTKSIHVGDLVYIKNEKDKFKARERYIVMQIRNSVAIIQKINGSSFMSRRYEVPLTSIYPVQPEETSFRPQIPTIESESDEDEDEDEDKDVSPSDNDDIAIENEASVTARPQRNRREPRWLLDDIWDRS